MNQVRVQQPSLPEYGYRFGPGVFNRDMAQAKSAGDQRFNMKEYDRAGMSRGGAAAREAATRGASAMAEGIAKAYDPSTSVELHNMAMQSEVEQERMAQALARMQAPNMNQQMGALLGLL